MASLDDLRRIIRRVERARPPRPAPEPPERVLGGELVETGEGPLLVVRREYPLAHRHGARPLGAAFEAAPDALALIARDAPGLDVDRLVFLDTETTGLAGGTGTYAFLVGVGAREGDRLVLRQYFLRDFDDEPALLAALAPVLAASSAVVTFNGSGFDVPLLETRFLLGRRRWREPPQVDLLRPARRVWWDGLADRRLGTLEREVLGLVRDDDVPGALIPGLYFEFLRHRRPRPLAPVFAHNRDDVLSLVGLLGWFAHALARPEEAGLRDAEWAGVGRLWEDADLERALACYRRALAAGLPDPLARWVRLRLAGWEKRRARWEDACALWEAVAGGAGFDPRPWEELAKFHEHRRRDFALAREIVESALGHAHSVGAGPDVVGAFTHRLGRLERRLAAATGPGGPR